MKAPLTLALLFLLAPLLPAASTLLEDGPPGFLHFQRLDDDDPTNVSTDTYVRISTIGAVTILTDKKNEKAPYTVRIQSYAMRYTMGERVEPLAFHLYFTKKEDAENMMLKITRLVTLSETK